MSKTSKTQPDTRLPDDPSYRVIAESPTGMRVVVPADEQPVQLSQAELDAHPFVNLIATLIYKRLTRQASQALQSSVLQSECSTDQQVRHKEQL